MIATSKQPAHPETSLTTRTIILSRRFDLGLGFRPRALALGDGNIPEAATATAAAAAAQSLLNYPGKGPGRKTFAYRTLGRATLMVHARRMHRSPPLDCTMF